MGDGVRRFSVLGRVCRRFSLVVGLVAFAASLGGSGRALAQQGPSGPELRPAPGSTGSVGPPVAPAPGFVRLVYSLGKGTSGCDGEVMFRRLVASETNQPDPFVPKGPPTHELRIGIERDPPGFRTMVELRSAGGGVLDHHEYAERTCADAVDRAVISVMLTVFPAPSSEKEEAPKGGDPPGPSKECAECDRAAAEARRRALNLEVRLSELTNRVDVLEKTSTQERRREGDMDLAFALSAGALMTANLTSDVGPGVWVGADARFKMLSVGVEMRAVLPAPVDLGPVDLDYSQLLLHVIPCGRYSYFFGCVVAGAGAQILADTNYPTRDPNTRFSQVLQLGARLGAEVPFGDTPIGARIWGEAMYTNPETSFGYPALGLRWDRPDVSAFFGLGLVVYLGHKEPM